MSTRTAIRKGTVTVTPCDHATWLVALQGEHDIATQPLLNQRTGGIWPRCNVAIIDLSSADFISSSVITWLHSLERDLEARGAFTLSVVTGPRDSAAARTLSLCGADERFACYATREEARAQVPDDASLARE
jgi:anti-anti-sigma regulatory factor